MSSDADRLRRAVERGLLPRLASAGFRLGSSTETTRGGLVILLGHGVQVEVSADWLEGEVTVDIQRPGEPVERVLRLARLPRGVTGAVLESRLRKGADPLAEHVERLR